jgi:hypothetical protein
MPMGDMRCSRWTSGEPKPISIIVA